MNESATLTRAEALEMIDARRPPQSQSFACLTELHRQWIGHTDHGCINADGLADLLEDYVRLCATSDDERSDGPKDSDDTGIPR